MTQGELIDPIALGPGEHIVSVLSSDNLGNGDVAVLTVTVLGPDVIDTDGDGIPDGIDQDPTNPSTAFVDAAGTNGDIQSNDTGETLMVVDLPDPAGVSIIVGGVTGEAWVAICDLFTVIFPAGTELDVTCGSATIGVVVGGPAIVQLSGFGLTIVSIPAGVTAQISEPAGGAFTVEHLAGVGAVVVTINGVATVISSGDPPVEFSSAPTTTAAPTTTTAPATTAVPTSSTLPATGVGNAVRISAPLGLGLLLAGLLALGGGTLIGARRRRQ